MRENDLVLSNVAINRGDSHSTSKNEWSTYAVIACVIWLLVGPRLSIVAVAGSSVRLEDFILIALWFYVAVAWRKIKPTIPSRPVLPITALSLLALVVNVAASRVELGPALLYSIRVLEYWAVFPALFFVVKSSRSNTLQVFVRMLGVITVIHVGVAAAQSIFGLDIGFSKFSADRGAGLTAGPYELGAMCSMLALFWLSRRNYVLAAVACLGLLLSSSRISILALVVGALVMIALNGTAGSTSKPGAGPRRLSMVVGAGVCGLLILGLSSGSSPSGAGGAGESLSERLASTSALTSWTLAGEVVSGISLPENSDEYAWVAYGAVRTLLNEANFVDAGGGETSDMVRFYRWHILIDSMNSPAKVLFGLGPSFAGPSVDGSYVRMVAETGLLGAVAWFLCLRRWTLNLATPTKSIFVALLVGAIFIDVLYSMKLMAMMWAFIAIDDAQAQKSAQEVPSLAVTKFEGSI